MVFNKALASLGVGAAKVDTRLEKAKFRQGEMIRGKIFIQGGQAEQQIDEIYLYLIVQYYHEGSQSEYVIEEKRLTDLIPISPREIKEIPFEFQLPYDSPISSYGSTLYLKTGLDIKMALDPSDMDGIDVEPHSIVDAVLIAAERVGFQLVSVEYDFEHYFSRHPFVQVYKLSPSGRYKEILDGLEFVFTAHEGHVDVIMNVDRKAVCFMSSMEEALELDRRLVPFTVKEEEIKEGGLVELQNRLEELIKPHLE